MGAIIPKPGWPDEDGSSTPMAGGIFDGLPEDQGGGLEMLLSPEDMADIQRGRGESGILPGAGSEAPRHPLDKVAQELASGVGKLWNLPNTVIGLAYGGLGYLAGQVGHAVGLQNDAPGISIGKNAVQFTDNPFGGVGAITIGNAEIMNGKPTDIGPDGNFVGAHEDKHARQGEQLGPFYLPSNGLGGLAGELIDGDWHGSHNWNEVGPQQQPPVPWPK